MPEFRGLETIEPGVGCIGAMDRAPHSRAPLLAMNGRRARGGTGTPALERID